MSRPLEELDVAELRVCQFGSGGGPGSASGPPGEDRARAGQGQEPVAEVGRAEAQGVAGVDLGQRLGGQPVGARGDRRGARRRPARCRPPRAAAVRRWRRRRRRSPGSAARAARTASGANVGVDAVRARGRSTDTVAAGSAASATRRRRARSRRRHRRRSATTSARPAARLRATVISWPGERGRIAAGRRPTVAPAHLEVAGPALLVRGVEHEADAFGPAGVDRRAG